MTLTKRELVTQISEATGYPQQEVQDVLIRILETISKSLANGETVELRSFGVFEVRVRRARVGRNPNAPETDVPIPQRAVVRFKPSKDMRAEVLKLPPEVILAKKVAKQRPKAPVKPPAPA